MTKLLAAVFCALVALCGPATAHGDYGGVYEFNNPDKANAQLCCGGDPQTGDCEQLTWEQIESTPDGGVIITSKRYDGARIYVPKARAYTGIPLNMNKTPPEPAMAHDPYAGHWCGKPRSTISAVGRDQVTPLQADPVFWTYCAFVKAGGV